MADQDDLAALAGVVAAFLVHLGDQRTGGVDHRQVAALRLFLHLRRDAVGAEDGDGAFGNLVEFLDEDGALGAQRFDDVLVVDDLVPDVDGRAVERQRALDDLDRAFDAGAEAARLRQKHAQRCLLGLLRSSASGCSPRLRPTRAASNHRRLREA